MSNIDEKKVLGPRWYVAHTFTGYENKVKTNIEKIVENRGLSHLIFDVQIPVETHVELNAKGEEKLVELNPYLPQVDLYKAGHHGSKTSSSNALLEVIQPDIVCVCCCAGSDEYTKNSDNQFPTQDFITRVAPYTDKIYVTTLCTDNEKGTFQSMNGNIVVLTDKNGLTVMCGSGDNRILKEWEWFKQNRACPAAWQ